ncbi:fibrinogen-like protein A [Ptychodera flava]|uniref:fibrinogen-like protein A n=1 Tax=Ptychodera flava TaxID=63121 RepID=UPI00396A842E
MSLKKDKMPAKALILFLLVIPVASQSTTAGNRGLVDLQSRYVKDGRCAYTFIMPDQNESPCNGEYDQALQRLSERIDHLEEGRSSYPLLNTTSYPVDCQHAYILNGNKLEEGVHFIQPEGYIEPFPVHCEVTEDGPWTIIQRRKDGSITFANEWQSYKYGFGQITGEHWMGNEKMYHLLRSDEYKLRIELEDWDGNSTYAEYDLFRIGDEASNYALWLGEYSGTAGDSMRYHVKAQFSTKDKDNDEASSCCACAFGRGRGGWWYYEDSGCHQSNLNGQYISQKSGSYFNIIWETWQGRRVSLKDTVMKVKRLRN